MCGLRVETDYADPVSRAAEQDTCRKSELTKGDKWAVEVIAESAGSKRFIAEIECPKDNEIRTVN